MKALAPLLVVCAAAMTAFAAAQPADSLALQRKEALADARYLKSIYKTDAAIERLSIIVFFYQHHHSSYTLNYRDSNDVKTGGLEEKVFFIPP